jgi:hypothetical protein
MRVWTVRAVRLGRLVLVMSLASCSERDAVRAGEYARDSGATIERRDASEASDDESATLIAAPDGDESAPGTLARPTTLTAALARVASGGTVYLRGGTYDYSESVTIARGNDGSAEATKTLSQYQREAPILSFSEQPEHGSDDAGGLKIEADYWHVVGLIVRGAVGAGIYVAGSHNRIERCATLQNRGSGLLLGPSSMSGDVTDNLVLNCESFDNAGDGFGAKLGVGAGDVFRGCVAHHNLGDGWDLASEAEITIDQCVAHTNCSLTDGTHSPSRDCSGFKLGGAQASHLVTRSVAYYNDRSGFTWGGNRGAVRLSNALAFDNAAGNYDFGDATTTSGAIFTNDVSVWIETAVAKSDAIFNSDAGASNRFWLADGSGVTVADFASMLHGLRLTRSAAGDLELAAFSLALQSALIDAGVVPEGRLPFEPSYYRGNPDLGAVETR